MCLKFYKKTLRLIKKLIFSILATFALAFAACGSDDKYVDPNVYIDNSVIMGKWYRVDGLDSAVFTFGKFIATEIVYDKYTKKERYRHRFQPYKLTKDRILFDNVTKGNLYYIAKDTLCIDFSSGTAYTKYMRLVK